MSTETSQYMRVRLTEVDIVRIRRACSLARLFAQDDSDEAVALGVLERRMATLVSQASTVVLADDERETLDA